MSLLTFKIVVMTLMLALMKVYLNFSFVCWITHMNAQKCCWMLTKKAKIVIESDLCPNVRIFALMNVSSHYWSSFHANDCVYSRNEQQKVYYNVMLGNFVCFFFLSFLSPPVPVQLYSKFWILALFCICLEQLDRILFKPHHIIFMMYIMPETFTTIDSLQHLEILRRAF